jgi:hypothetical protein
MIPKNKNTTKQCKNKEKHHKQNRNENKNNTKQCRNNEKKAQNNVGMKTKTPQNNVRIMNCFHSYIVLWCFSLFLHCFVVFFIIPTLLCGVFAFSPTLYCIFHYSYIVLWCFSLLNNEN